MKWVENYRVNSHDTDVNCIASASATLRYFQETANLQLLKLGPSNEQLREDGKAFILSKFSMSVYKPLYAYDEISVETWACESKGASFTRCGQLLRDGMIAAEIISVWALVDIKSRRLCCVNEVEFNFGTDELLELDLPPRFRIPRELSLTLVGERTVVYSDLDLNRHMNNTKYPDMLCDFVQGMEHRRVIGLSANFLNESSFNETLKVYSTESDDAVYFRTIKEDGSIGIEAEMLLEDVRQ